MSNDMRIVKFEMMIRDIGEDLHKEVLTDSPNYVNYKCEIAWLAIIYDYDKLNDYGKVIMEQVCKLDKNEFGADKNFSDIIKFVENCKDMEYRMKAAKALAVKLNEKTTDLYDRNPKRLLFIFWSLMILTVDDNDKEEHLSLICDFAKMLKISDIEMMDIVQIIRAIYHMEGNFNIIASDVILYFRNVIKRYRVKVSTGTQDETLGMMCGRMLGAAAGPLVELEL